MGEGPALEEAPGAALVPALASGLGEACVEGDDVAADPQLAIATAMAARIAALRANESGPDIVPIVAPGT